MRNRYFKREQWRSLIEQQEASGESVTQFCRHHDLAPKTKLGAALHFLHAQWQRLLRYLDDGRYPIDKNPIQNAIRPFAIGRKNWLLSKLTDGARASANLCSLIETAKGHGIEPYAYLRHVFTQLPLAETIEDIDALLPSKVKDGVCRRLRSWGLLAASILIGIKFHFLSAKWTRLA